MKAINTDQAPAAIGPYSQALQVANMVYTAGQIALDPESGKLVDGDVTQQTERALENLGAILRAAGTSFEKVIKTTVFLQDLADFPKVNEVYARYMGTAPPARSTIQVAALPLGALVEIEAIAVVP
jgi:2-iminobutanoate/2-iminopropanoate deaminase